MQFGGPAISFETRYDLAQIQKFEAVLNRWDYSIQQFSNILEFGCGFGRLIQYMFKLVPNAKIHGCDVLLQAVAACRRKFSRGVFLVNHSAPPVNFADHQFDFIYSYSVFTHLSETNHRAWLTELARLLKSGGVMLHSIKSYAFLHRASLFSPEALSKYELPTSITEFVSQQKRYHYVIDNPCTPEYGLTIISKDYVLERWPAYSGLEVLEYAEGEIETYPEGCHDVVLLRRK
jgi:cyclopropane fatty-acyl-phospholipid synthase-like methyltransferase